MAVHEGQLSKDWGHYVTGGRDKKGGMGTNVDRLDSGVMAEMTV